jgi:hypothetical protein
MEDFGAGLLGLLVEIFGEFLIEMLFGVAAEALETFIFAGLKISTASISAFGLAIVGAIAGLLSSWAFPHRLFVVRVTLPGVSLLVAPLVTGLSLDFAGRQLRRFYKNPGSIATFRGGVVFAFSMAVVRWWLVGSVR